MKTKTLSLLLTLLGIPPLLWASNSKAAQIWKPYKKSLLEQAKKQKKLLQILITNPG